MREHLIRWTAPAAIGLVLAAGLIAGTAPVPATAHGAKTYNRHDVTFVQMLLPHHQSAVRAAKVAQARATNSEVRSLARQIVRAQTKDIAEMRRLLVRFNAHPEPEPAPVEQMSRQDLAELRAAKGVGVDRKFVEIMRPHHAQAIAEAMDELEHGKDPQARRLAARNLRQQTAELAKLNRLHELLVG
jgi:uncharacterized protein (DUF305 family)